MQLDDFVVHVVQDIKQVSNIEPDIQGVAVIVDFKLLQCLFLFNVAGKNIETSGAEDQTHTAKLFVGQDGGT
jgi:hypothetical protein